MNVATYLLWTTDPAYLVAGSLIAGIAIGFGLFTLAQRIDAIGAHAQARREVAFLARYCGKRNARRLSTSSKTVRNAFAEAESPATECSNSQTSFSNSASCDNVIRPMARAKQVASAPNNSRVESSSGGIEPSSLSLRVSLTKCRAGFNPNKAGTA